MVGCWLTPCPDKARRCVHNRTRDRMPLPLGKGNQQLGVTVACTSKHSHKHLEAINKWLMVLKAVG